MATTDYRVGNIDGFRESGGISTPSAEELMIVGGEFTPESIIERVMSKEDYAMVKKIIDLQFYQLSSQIESDISTVGSMMLSALKAYDYGGEFKKFPPLVQHLIVKYFNSQKDSSPESNLFERR